jgi:hypothetical protein
MSADFVEKSVSEMSDQPNPSSEPFYIFASIRPPLSETEVIIPNLKSLHGKWKVALRELSLTRSPVTAVQQQPVTLPSARSQPLQFLIAAPANCYTAFEEFLHNFKGIKNESFGRWERLFDCKMFPDFPYMAVVTAQNRDGTTVMLPGGQKTLENFIVETNEVLKKYFTNHEGRIQFNGIRIKQEADHIGISSDTAKGVHIFPIFNQDLGRIFGLPQLCSNTFSMVINAMKDNGNLIISRNDIIQSPTDLFIQCSIVEQNSNVSTSAPGKGSGEGSENSSNNRILRFISQAHLQKDSHGGPVLMSFVDDPFYVPVIEKKGSLYIQSFKIRVLAAETMKPINMEGKINLTLHFTPNVGDQVFINRRSTIPAQILESDALPLVPSESIPLVSATKD